METHLFWGQKVNGQDHESQKILLEMACFSAFWASWCGDCLDVTAYAVLVYSYCYKPILLPKLLNVYSYLKFPSQVYHRPMPHTKFVNFNIAGTKTGCTVAYYVAYSVPY